MGGQTAYVQLGYLGGTVRQSAPVNLAYHQSTLQAGDATRLAYIKHCSFTSCLRYGVFTACLGTSGDPLLITGNTLNDASGGATWDGFGLFSGSSSYLTFDGNSINHRGTVFDFNSLVADSPGIRITNNSGVVGLQFLGVVNGPYPTTGQPDIAYQYAPCTPDLYIGGNTLSGTGESTIDARFLNPSGTPGHPCIVENNWIHHCHRLGNVVGSHITFRKNRFGLCYHHGFTGSSNNDTFCTDLTWENNLWYSDRGATTNPPCINLGYNHVTTSHNITVANNTVDGWGKGLVDYGDAVDNSGRSLVTNIAVINNVIANNAYAFGTYATGSLINSHHVIEADYNNLYSQATLYGYNLANNTVPTGFYQGSNKYNRLTGGGRNVSGVALFDATDTTAAGGRDLVWTVNAAGQDITLSWGGGTPVQLVYDYGTSSGGGLRTLGCTGKTWASNRTSLFTNWLWIVSGTGAGQARPITRATANTAVTVAKNAGGTGYSLGQYLAVSGGTTDAQGTDGFASSPCGIVLKVTGVSAGAVTSLAIISGGTYSTPPLTTAAATTRITGTGSSGCTVDLTFAPVSWSFRISPRRSTPQAFSR